MPPQRNLQAVTSTAVSSPSNPSPNCNEGASRVMCAVLIAENTANAHHMPQSISRHRRRLRRIFDRNIKRKTVNKGLSCFGRGRFSVRFSGVGARALSLAWLLGCVPLRLHAGFRFSLGWVRAFGAEKSGAQISHQHIRNLSKI